MDAKEFESLYKTLFGIAWNTDFINPNDESFITALKDASTLFNKIRIKMDDVEADWALYHFKTDITIHKSRKKYLCINDESHVINKSGHYARIAHFSSPMAWSETMCLTCAARIFIILLTNFNPIGSGGGFYYPLTDSPEEL